MSLDTLYQAVLDWVRVGAVGPVATALTSAQVIRADQDGPRPPRPFMTVKLIATDIIEGIDEEIDGVDAGTPNRAISGERTAALSVQGFGIETHDWLSTLGLSVRRPSIVLQLVTSKITISDFAAITDLTARVDTSMEPRFLREFDLAYRVMGDPEDVVELLLVEADADFTGSGTTLETDISITL